MNRVCSIIKKIGIHLITMRHLYAKFVCKISPEWNNLRKKMFLPKVTFLWNLHIYIIYKIKQDIYIDFPSEFVCGQSWVAWG